MQNRSSGFRDRYHLFSWAHFGPSYTAVFFELVLLVPAWWQNAITKLEFSVAAPPSVGDVQISGDVVEGNTIRGIGRYFGGKEGPSKFEWLREDKDTG